MAVRIYIPTWATFRRFPAGSPADGLAALAATLGLNQFQPGDVNPVWEDLQDLDLGGGSITRGQTLLDMSHVSEIENATFITIQHIGLVMAIGGEVAGYPVYFQIDDPAAATPEGLYRSQAADGGQLTWAEWMRPDLQPLIEHAGKYYKAAVNEHGAPLPASAWFRLVASGAVVILSASELQTMLEPTVDPSGNFPSDNDSRGHDSGGNDSSGNDFSDHDLSAGELATHSISGADDESDLGQTPP